MPHPRRIRAAESSVAQWLPRRDGMFSLCEPRPLAKDISVGVCRVR